ELRQTARPEFVGARPETGCAEVSDMHHEGQGGLIQFSEQIRQPGFLYGKISKVTNEGKDKSARRSILGGERLAVACGTHAQQHAEEESTEHEVCCHRSLPFRGRDFHQPLWKTPNTSAQPPL